MLSLESRVFFTQTRQNMLQDNFNEQNKELLKLKKVVDIQQKNIDRLEKKEKGVSNSINKVLNLQATYQHENNVHLEKTYRKLKTEIVDEAARRERLRILHTISSPL